MLKYCTIATTHMLVFHGCTGNGSCEVTDLTDQTFYDCPGTDAPYTACSDTATDGFMSYPYKCIVSLSECGTVNGWYGCTVVTESVDLYSCEFDPNGASDLTAKAKTCELVGSGNMPENGFFVYQCAIASSVETNYRCRKLPARIVPGQIAGYCYYDTIEDVNLACEDIQSTNKQTFTKCSVTGPTDPYLDGIPETNCNQETGGVSLDCYRSLESGRLFGCTPTP